MKKILLILILSCLSIISCSDSSNKGTQVGAKELNPYILAQNKKLISRLETLEKLSSEKAPNVELQNTLAEARKIFKTYEWAVAYYQPNTQRFLNGPALPEIEWEEGVVLEPQGFQVIEEIVFEDQPDYGELTRLIKLAKTSAQAIDTYFSVNTLSRSQVFDALLLQIHRISTLGISGFDTPVSGWGIDEIQPSLQGIRHALGLILTKEHSQALGDLDKRITALNEFIQVQKTNQKENHSFDYLALIKDYLTPILNSIQQLQKAEEVAHAEAGYAIDLDAPSLFAPNAIQRKAFEEFPKEIDFNQMQALGKDLFQDPILSSSGTMACITCHHPDKAFSDGKKTSPGLSGQPLLRNTPSLNYSLFQHRQFWDMRKENLASQSEDVITNKEEMHGDLKVIAQKLNSQPAYQKKFQQVFKNQTITDREIKLSLAAYIAGLSKFNSVFDRYMRGEIKELDPKVKNGFNLFMGKAKCATCHFLPVFNGTVPPEMKKTEQEVLGTPATAENKKLDSDKGRGRLYPHIPNLSNSFKTPTVRNAAQSAPYMHNGVYSTLQQVIDFYNRGGGAGMGLKVENQTLPADPLHLTPVEQEDLIRFLEALSDQ